MFWLERAFAERHVDSATFSKIAIYLLPRRPYTSYIRFTSRRPYDNSYTTNADETVSTTNSVQVRVTTSINDTTNSSIITILSEANVCWRWWPSLRMVYQCCALPNTPAGRHRARQLLIKHASLTSYEKALTMDSIHRMSMHNLKRNLVSAVAVYNRKLALRHFGFDNSVDISIVSGNGNLLISIPLGIADAVVKLPCAGRFYRDTERSPWGLFLSDDGFRMRVVHPMLRFSEYDETKTECRCELVSKSINHAWTQHVWNRVKEEVSARTGTESVSSIPTPTDHAPLSVSSRRRRTLRRTRRPT